MSKPNGAKSDTKTPIDCYRAVVCQTVITSMTTGNPISFVNVAEMWALPEQLFGQMFAVEGHFGFFGNGDYEVRALWVDERDPSDPVTTALAATCPATDEPSAITVDGRFRLNIPALRLPKVVGLWALTLEWRHKGELNWHRGAARCPVIVAAQAKATDSPSAAARA